MIFYKFMKLAKKFMFLVKPSKSPLKMNYYGMLQKGEIGKQ